MLYTWMAGCWLVSWFVLLFGLLGLALCIFIWFGRLLACLLTRLLCCGMGQMFTGTWFNHRREDVCMVSPCQSNQAEGSKGSMPIAVCEHLSRCEEPGYRRGCEQESSLRLHTSPFLRQDPEQDTGEPPSAGPKCLDGGHGSEALWLLNLHACSTSQPRAEC